MNNLSICISIELKKLFKSKLPLISICALMLVPFVGGFFIFILKDPELAKNLGFISAKANIMGSADWLSYLSLLSQAIAIGGLVVFGFITSWIFGREYSDRTIKDLLALPIPRATIVLSKFATIFIWCLSLSIFVLILGLVVGYFIDIPMYSPQVIREGIIVFGICSLLSVILSTPVALLACMGRGYLSPLGFMVFTIVIAQIIAATGYGEFFPWSIPAIMSGMAGSQYLFNKGISILIVLLTGLLGVLFTLYFWKNVDQN